MYRVRKWESKGASCLTRDANERFRRQTIPKQANKIIKNNNTNPGVHTAMSELPLLALDSAILNELGPGPAIPNGSGPSSSWREFSDGTGDT